MRSMQNLISGPFSWIDRTWRAHCESMPPWRNQLHGMPIFRLQHVDRISGCDTLPLSQPPQESGWTAGQVARLRAAFERYDFFHNFGIEPGWVLSDNPQQPATLCSARIKETNKEMILFPCSPPPERALQPENILALFSWLVAHEAAHWHQRRVYRILSPEKSPLQSMSLLVHSPDGDPSELLRGMGDILQAFHIPPLTPFLGEEGTKHFGSPQLWDLPFARALASATFEVDADRRALRTLGAEGVAQGVIVALLQLLDLRAYPQLLHEALHAPFQARHAALIQYVEECVCSSENSWLRDRTSRIRQHLLLLRDRIGAADLSACIAADGRVSVPEIPQLQAKDGKILTRVFRDFLAKARPKGPYPEALSQTPAERFAPSETAADHDAFEAAYRRACEKLDYDFQRMRHTTQGIIEIGRTIEGPARQQAIARLGAWLNKSFGKSDSPLIACVGNYQELRLYSHLAGFLLEGKPQEFDTGGQALLLACATNHGLSPVVKSVRNILLSLYRHPLDTYALEFTELWINNLQRYLAGHPAGEAHLEQVSASLADILTYLSHTIDEFPEDSRVRLGELVWNLLSTWELLIKEAARTNRDAYLLAFTGINVALRREACHPELRALLLDFRGAVTPVGMLHPFVIQETDRGRFLASETGEVFLGCPIADSYGSYWTLDGVTKQVVVEGINRRFR